MTNEQDRATKRNTPRLIHATQVMGMLVTLFLFIAHIIKWEAIRVDAVTLALLGFLIIIPLAELIRKIKLGEFEAEIGREDIAKVQAKAAIDLPLSSVPTIAISEARVRILSDEDPRLAVAKVRIELEEALKRLYAADAKQEPNWRRLSLRRLIDNLIQREVLSPPVAGAFRDVIDLANRAVHSERVEPDVAKQLAVLGVRLIHEIHQLYMERALRPVETTVISRDEVNGYNTSRYKVTTVVPLIENPTRNTYILEQNALESFLEGYEEYAEFIVNIERV